MRELGIPVMDERFRFDLERFELPEQIARLLCDPSTGRMGCRLREQEAPGI